MLHLPHAHAAPDRQGREARNPGLRPSPADAEHKGLKTAAAADGVSCSVCHQIQSTGLGTPATFVGNVVVAGPSNQSNRPEYGPFAIDAGHMRVMQSSTAGFVPVQSAHIRDSGLCGSCHTLYTIARGPGGKEVGKLPEQMPYLEWLHSDYRDRQSCQQCHMPEVHEAVAVTALFGQPREGMHRHTFVGGNFLLERMLNDHRSDLDVKAQPRELEEAAGRTEEFLRTQSARLTLSAIHPTAAGLSFDVDVANLTGHKLPTAYPSRRAWLHVVVRDRNNQVVFESGALRPDGSIAGNVNDADPKRFEPHFSQITQPGQVQIFESILKDSQGQVTTGLLSAVGYLKDNRILPTGFDKQTADPDIAVIGDALTDPAFTGGSARTRYSVATSAPGPFHVTVELWYQPIGYRWAHNLAPYQAAEPQRFVGYYEQAAARSALMLAAADSTSTAESAQTR